MRFDSKPIVLELLSYGRFGSLDWAIPHFDTKEEKVEFLRAFFDSEAHVSKRGSIQAQSVNLYGLLQIQKSLAEMGIQSKIYSYQRQNPNWNTNYILNINKRNINKFLKDIGFYHKKKQNRLASVA